MAEEQQPYIPELLRRDVLNHVRHVYGARPTYEGCAYAMFSRHTGNTWTSALMFHSPITRDGVRFPWREGEWAYAADKYTWPYDEACGIALENAMTDVLDGLGFIREHVPSMREIGKEHKDALPENVLPFRKPDVTLERRVA